MYVGSIERAPWRRIPGGSKESPGEGQATPSKRAPGTARAAGTRRRKPAELPRWKMDAEGLKRVAQGAEKVQTEPTKQTSGKPHSGKKRMMPSSHCLGSTRSIYCPTTAQRPTLGVHVRGGAPPVEESRQMSSPTWMRCRDTAGEKTGMGNLSQQVGNLEFPCKQDRPGGGCTAGQKLLLTCRNRLDIAYWPVDGGGAWSMEYGAPMEHGVPSTEKSALLHDLLYLPWLLESRTRYGAGRPYVHVWQREVDARSSNEQPGAAPGASMRPQEPENCPGPRDTEPRKVDRSRGARPLEG
ncbi:hypothetical protein BGZ61DRAFT_481675 [Ilyonectria robusta]|uniref:uncharacterized protein n=1 Tax=Ilyonectria robusta TaxID=1079257 RepID=UPI001E8CEA2C|nr:uncharacterized protein BGZ61DRAFT_481675 [Ilyonectria robusta]KAH8677063.1 hypothetical protein BGZ61DRAFT_481675 [Ilyonectria robusta]